MNWKDNPSTRVIDVDTLGDNVIDTDLTHVGSVVVRGTTQYRVVDQQPATQFALLIKLVQQCVEQDIPFFGIGYGAHLLAVALDGVVEHVPHREEEGEVVLHRVSPADHDPLFHDFPQDTLAIAYRNDDITQLPIVAVPLLNSDNAQVHAFKIAGKPVYGVQFHPELDDPRTPEANAVMKRFFARIVDKIG